MISIEPPIQPPRNSQRSWLLALLLLWAFQFFATVPAMNYPGVVMDEGMLLYYPELLSKGLLAQRDFESMYPPGNIWLLSGAYSVFGTSVMTERVIGMVYQMALVSAFFVLLLRWSLVVAVAGGVLCVFALLPLNLVAFAWVGASALAMWSLVAISAPGTPGRCGVLAGALAAGALTFRIDMAPALVLALAGYCLFAQWKTRAVFSLLGSASLGLVPLLVHILVVSPGKFFENVFTKPVLICSRGRALPLDFSRAMIGQLYAVLLIATGFGLLAGWRVYRTSGNKNPALLGASLFCLGALHQALMRPDITHLSFVTALGFPLLAAAAAVLFSRHVLSPFAAILSVGLLVPQTSEILCHRFTATSLPAGSVFTLHSGARTFPIANPFYAKACQEVISQLLARSRPGETLFVGPQDLRFAVGSDVFLYHMLPLLRPRSYFLEMNPLSANGTHSKLAEEIADTDWLVLSSVWDEMKEPNFSQVPGPATPNEVVRERFELVFEKDPFTIYKRRVPAASSPLTMDGPEAIGVNP